MGNKQDKKQEDEKIQEPRCPNCNNIIDRLVELGSCAYEVEVMVGKAGFLDTCKDNATDYSNETVDEYVCPLCRKRVVCSYREAELFLKGKAVVARR